MRTVVGGESGSPRCLADNGGCWLLDWLSPWIQVCTRHAVFLITRCPACHQSPRGVFLARSGEPAGTRCTACNSDLTTGATHPAPTTSYAHLGQAYVNELRRHSPAETVPTPDGSHAVPSDQFQDLRLLARHVHAVARPGDYDLTGTEAADWHAWATHRDRPSTLDAVHADPVYGSRYGRTETEVATYAAAVGIAVTVAASDDVQSASARLAPVLYPAFLRRSASITSYAIRRAWATEDAAQWLLDAVKWRA